MDRDTMQHRVDSALARQPITDMHTHCYPPGFGASPAPGGLLLWGIDELVTYHYLIAEVYRVVPAESGGRSNALDYETFWQWSRAEQADHIWKHLFVDRTPISEACRGVLTALAKLGLDPNEKSLDPYRCWFAQQAPSEYIDRVMELSNVDSITMTNPVFDDRERQAWLKDPTIGDDPRFSAVLRIDPLLCDWPGAARKLCEWGYDVGEEFTKRTCDQVRRFLTDWLDRMKAIYVAVSLPPSFRYGESGDPFADRFIEACLTPVCADRGLPFAMMIGSRRGVNPALGDAGDMVGKADVQSVVRLCARFAKNKFLVTMLSSENQHELCVAARKFGNLMIFGCWWFVNNPSIIDRITRERMELLGTSFIAQHSDARILDQLLYKWDHSLKTIAKVLTDKYLDVAASGFNVTDAHIAHDVSLLLRENFREFLRR